MSGHSESVSWDKEPRVSPDCKGRMRDADGVAGDRGHTVSRGSAEIPRAVQELPRVFARPGHFARGFVVGLAMNSEAKRLVVMF